MKINSKVLALMFLLEFSFNSMMKSMFSEIYYIVEPFELGRGIICVALVQPINLIAFAFFKGKKSSISVAYFELLAYVIFSVLSFSGIVLMCFLSCNRKFKYFTY